MIGFTNRAFLGAATLFATVATVAAATPLRAETVSTRVGYGDLDLASDAGQAALDRRIHRAVNFVCGPRDRLNRAAVLQCRKQASAAATTTLRLAAMKADREAMRVASR